MSKKTYSPEQMDELAKLQAMPDAEIDIDDIPEAPAENWLRAKRGGSERYRMVQRPCGK